jgi:shikimate kinase
LKKRFGKTVDARVRRRMQSRGPHDTAFSGTSVFLVGFMGAGKTSVGRTLAQRLNWDFEDLDERIERREKRKVAEIFRDSGESEFRRAEHAALQDLLEELRAGTAKVVALGGGAFVQQKNADLLKASGVPSVFLDAPVEELWQRCCKQATESGAERPLLRSIEEFRRLYQERSNSYRLASISTDTARRTFDEIAAEIAEKLALKAIESRTQEGEVE